MAKTPATFTVDDDLLAELRHRVEAGEAPSASALVVEALREHLRGATLAALVAELVGGEPLTAEEQAWADAQLER
jgi:hypothetical protein